MSESGEGRPTEQVTTSVAENATVTVTRPDGRIISAEKAFAPTNQYRKPMNESAEVNPTDTVTVTRPDGKVVSAERAMASTNHYRKPMRPTK